MSRYNKRTDFNQAGIISELRARGVSVTISNFGQGWPDLLCAYQGHWIMLEIKQETGSLDRGQLRWLSAAKGRVGVATNFNEALEVVTGTGISKEGKECIAKWLVRNPSQETLSVKRFFKLVEESSPRFAATVSAVVGGEKGEQL